MVDDIWAKVPSLKLGENGVLESSFQFSSRRINEKKGANMNQHFKKLTIDSSRRALKNEYHVMGFGV